MSKIAIILLHRGPSDPLSVSISNKIDESGVIGITKIRVGDPKVEEWLRNNQKGVVIREYPTFLVAEEGRPTQVYNGNEVDNIIDLVRSISS